MYIVWSKASNDKGLRIVFIIYNNVRLLSMHWRWRWRIMAETYAETTPGNANAWPCMVWLSVCVLYVWYMYVRERASCVNIYLRCWEISRIHPPDQFVCEKKNVKSFCFRWITFNLMKYDTKVVGIKIQPNFDLGVGLCSSKGQRRWLIKYGKIAKIAKSLDWHYKRNHITPEITYHLLSYWLIYVHMHS